MAGPVPGKSLEDFAVRAEHAGGSPTAAGYREQRGAWSGRRTRGTGRGTTARATGDDGRLARHTTRTWKRIFLNTQTWRGILAGTSPRGTPNDRGGRERHPAPRHGPAAFRPAYTQPDAGIGYITRYARGSRRTAGVYARGDLGLSRGVRGEGRRVRRTHLEEHLAAAALPATASVPRRMYVTPGKRGRARFAGPRSRPGGLNTPARRRG